MIDIPNTIKIIKVKKETPTVKTFTLDMALEGIPGQFAMVWIPRVDEIPISISSFDPLEITVKDVGEATNALHGKRKGDYIGIRGPYGNGYSLKGKKILAVGGGVGIAPLRTLMLNTNKKFTVVLGSQTKREIFFEKDFRNAGAEVIICTDDGTYGKKAFATTASEELLEKRKYDLMAACGPEIMLKFLFPIAENAGIPVEFSMERWMKCGFGICGHCSLEPTGWRVCKEGPVFNTAQLKQVSEFFNFKRDAAGLEVKI